MNNIKETFKQLLVLKKKTKQVKKKSKALDKIILLCKKYNLKLTRDEGEILIIREIFDFENKK